MDALRKLQLSGYGTALRGCTGVEPQNRYAVSFLQLSRNDPAPVFSSLDAIIIPDTTGHLLELFQDRVDLFFVIMRIANEYIVFCADVGQFNVMFIVQFLLTTAGFCKIAEYCSCNAS